MSTDISPAEQARRVLQQAEAKALADAWNEYLETQEKHLAILRGEVPEKIIHHGTLTGYTHRSCRCDECKKAWRDYMREYTRKRNEADPKPPKEKKAPKGVNGRPVKDHMHGTQTGYAYGCRCDRCKDAAYRSKPKRLTSGVNHGTLTAYVTYKCRCRRCVKAKAEYAKEYRKRQNEDRKSDS